MNDITDQRARILDALRVGPLTSLEAIQNLGILRAAARVHELREEGHRIVTVWSCTWVNGKIRRIARYVLLKRAA